DPTLGADLLMRANNPTRIEDTEEPAQGTYLFNHFLAPDPHSALQGWKSVAGWYTTKVGVDNSTPLHPVDQAPFALVNYARLRGGALPFLAGQLVRPSFHNFVRARLAQHQMVPLPVLYRPVSSPFTPKAAHLPHDRATRPVTSGHGTGQTRRQHPQEPSPTPYAGTGRRCTALRPFAGNLFPPCALGDARPTAPA